jgi:hypothetical protein
MSQEVEVKIKVNTGQAVTDVNKLGDAFDNTAKDAQDAQEVFSKAGNGVQVEQSIAGLKQLKRELKNTAVGSEEFKKLYNDIDDLEDKLKSAKNTSADWVDSLENAGGPIGALGAGLNKAKVATQSFGGALKATGIGLIVSLLGGLVASFQGNEVAMKKIQPLFDGLKKITFGIFKAVEPLVDVFMDLAMKALPYVSKAVSAVYSGMMAYFTFLKEAGGGAMQVLEGVFTLDADKISAGIDKVKGSFGKAGDTYKKSMKAFGEGEKQLTEAEKEALEKRKEAQEKANEASKARREKEREARKQQLDALKSLEEKYANEALDLTAKTDEEKLKLEKKRALKELDAINLSEKEKAKAKELILKDFQLKEEALAKSHADKLTELNKKFEDEKKNLLAVSDEDKLKLSQENAMKQLEIDLLNLNATETEKETARKNLKENFAIQDAELQKAKDEKTREENISKIGIELEDENTSFEAKKQLILDREALLLQDQQLTETQRTKIHKDSVEAQMKIDDLQAQQKKAQAQEASETLGKLSDLAGKDTATGKALGIASALINTYVGASEALKQKSTLPSPFDVVAKVANVATILATGFKTVKAITSVKVPSGGGGGGGATPSIGGISAPSAMSPSTNVVSASPTNAIADTIAKQGQQPIKTYVVANDVTTAQGLERSIVQSASIG